jgi:predicted nucleotidyltransferase
MSNDIGKQLIQLSHKYINEKLSKSLSDVWDDVGITLGGSVAYGEADEFSDIDLFVNSDNDLGDLLPINELYEGKDINVDTGYSWNQLEGYLESLPEDAESFFWGVQNALVLYDPNGRFQRIKEKIDQYLPDEIWQRKVLNRWDLVYSSITSVKKALKREEQVIAQVWKGKLLQNMMELTFLLNRQYIPPIKWIHRKFVELPLLSKEIEVRLQKIIEINNYEDMKKEGQLVWNLFHTFIKENNVLPAEMVDKPWLY